VDNQALMRQLVAEHPAVMESIQNAIAACGARNQMDGVLLALLQMQHTINDQRQRAAGMLQPRSGLYEGHWALRHIPDVMLRELCAIANLPFHSNAKPEWLDMMKARGDSHAVYTVNSQPAPYEVSHE